MRDCRRPFFQRLAQFQPIPALLHYHAQHDGWLAVMANEIGGGVLISAAHLGEIRKFEDAPGCDDGRIGNRLDTVIGAIEPNEDLRPLRIDRTRRGDGIASLQGGSNVLRRYSQGRQLGIGEFHENLFRLLAENVDLLHAGNVKHVLTDRLGLTHEVTHRHAFGFQGIKREADVGIFVVDKGTDHPRRKIAGFVSKFLARLVKFPFNGRCRRIIPERHGQEGVAGARGRFHAIVPG